jgi:hypothetical protein
MSLSIKGNTNNDFGAKAPLATVLELDFGQDN